MPLKILWALLDIIVAGAIGLVAALLSDEGGDWLGWSKWAAPVAIVLCYLPPRRNGRAVAAVQLGTTQENS